MCNKPGISKEQSQAVTDDLYYYRLDPEMVYNALMEMKK
jgi:hypothetical protein